MPPIIEKDKKDLLGKKMKSTFSRAETSLGGVRVFLHIAEAPKVANAGIPGIPGQDGGFFPMATPHNADLPTVQPPLFSIYKSLNIKKAVA